MHQHTDQTNLQLQKSRQNFKDNLKVDVDCNPRFNDVDNKMTTKDIALSPFKSSDGNKPQDVVTNFGMELKPKNLFGDRSTEDIINNQKTNLAN